MDWFNGWVTLHKEVNGIHYYVHITSDHIDNDEIDGPPFLAELVCTRSHDEASEWFAPWTLDRSRVVPRITERRCAMLGIRSNLELYLLPVPILAPGEEAAFIVPVTRLPFFYPANEGSLPVSH